jgi:hypothetical protein
VRPSSGINLAYYCINLAVSGKEVSTSLDGEGTPGPHLPDGIFLSPLRAVKKLGKQIDAGNGCQFHIVDDS